MTGTITLSIEGPIAAITFDRAETRNPLGLANAENVLQRAYIENAQNNPSVPKADGIVPQLLKRVMPVHEAVFVEFEIVNTGHNKPHRRRIHRI